MNSHNWQRSPIKAIVSGLSMTCAVIVVIGWMGWSLNHSNLTGDVAVLSREQSMIPFRTGMMVLLLLAVLLGTIWTVVFYTVFNWKTALEQKIAGYEKELEEHKLTENELIEVRETAETANRVKSDFLANMSHEIRTPMTAILGFADILLSEYSAEGVSSERVQALETIKRNGDYLLQLINDILDLSKIEAGKMEVESISFSPSGVLTEVVSLLNVRAKEKNLSLEIEYEGPIPEHIQSDPTRLRQILINLAGNAIKFTESGKVRMIARLLDAQSDDPKMQFEVIDSGIGMNDCQIAKLFKPFHQADPSIARKFGGTGLGLTISKQLAYNLGGDIAIRSAQGQGSTFTATIGTGSLDGVKLSVVPKDNPPSTASEGKSDSKLNCRVLLAEDGPDNQRLISIILKQAGAEVVLADDGQVALELALAAQKKGTPFDVILMDMQMPILDGYAATGKLREAGYTGSIVALTANAMTGDMDKCLNAGCDNYATKPINRKSLVEIVANHTRTA